MRDLDGNTLKPFAPEEIEEMKGAGEDYARDFISWNKGKSVEEIRQELVSSTSDMAMNWSEDGMSIDARSESAADFVYEGMVKVLKEKFGPKVPQ